MKGNDLNSSGQTKEDKTEKIGTHKKRGANENF